MEEDLKILENYIYGKKETMKEQLCPAIENLINRNKELEEENEIYKNIKILMDNEILGYMEGYRAGRNGTTGIAKVGENYEKHILNTKLNQYKERYIEIRRLLDDSIPKSKIKEKIEELERDIEDYLKTDNSGRFTRENCRMTDEVNILKELLEE